MELASMDKRRKHIDQDAERALREHFFEDIAAGKLSLTDAVKIMRRISRLTQVEFARHRGISIGALKQIESGQGNPQIETLEKIGAIFGVSIGFVLKPKDSKTLRAEELPH
jgi:DNA-binding XRE family transcriptional regulator